MTSPIRSSVGVKPGIELQTFAAVADRCSEFIGICDMEFHPFYVNPAGLQLVGLESLEEALSVSVTDFFFPEDVPFLLGDFFPRVMREGQNEVEVRFRHFKTGEALWMIYNVFIVKDSAGNAAGIATFSQNITDRKYAEEALQEKGERLRAALTASGTGTFRWDIQTNAVDWDENLDRLFGVPPGHSVRSLENFTAKVHPEEREEVIERCQRCAMEGADFDMEFRVIWPDDSIHWLDDKGKTFFDSEGRPLYMTGACVDITERKRTDEALRHSEEKYRSLFESIDEGFCISELIYDDAGKPINHRYLEVNESFSRQNGFEDPVGKTARDFAPELDPSWFERYHQVLQTGKAARFEVHYAKKNSWFDVYASRVGGEGSNKLAIVFNNITARKQAEEAIRRSEQLAAAGRMAAVVAHEINNPLASVVNLWYLLEQQEMSAKAREYLAMAGLELDRVVYIAKQALSFYRGPSRPGTVELAAVVDDVVASTQSTAAIQGTQISVEHRDHVSVSGHDTEIRQVVANLLNNAIEAGSSSVKIRVSKSFDWTQPTRRGVRMTIADNGLGIPKDRIPFVLEPFYTTKETKGTGLGLWVSNGIVLKYQGVMSLRSTTRRGRSGTCFSIFLPEATLR